MKKNEGMAGTECTLQHINRGVTFGTNADSEDVCISTVYAHFLTPATRPLFFNDKCLRVGEREESNRGSAVSCLGALCICAANSDAASCFPPRGSRHRPVVTLHYTAGKIIVSSPADRPGSHARDERRCGTQMPMACFPAFA